MNDYVSLMRPGPTLRPNQPGLLSAIADSPAVGLLGMIPFAPAQVAAGLLGSAPYLAGEKSPEEGAAALAMVTGLLQGTRVAPIISNAMKVSRILGNRKYFDDKGVFVEEANLPNGKTVYRLGTPGTFEGQPNPRFDQYLGDWLGKPYASEAEALASVKSAKLSDLAQQRAMKYASIPPHFQGEEKKLAKALIDRFGDGNVSFASSSFGDSVYMNTPAGKIRLSGHELPSHYDAPDYDLRRGGFDLQQFVKSLQTGE